MRGNSDPQLAMLSTLSTEDLIPADHPIRKIRVVVDAVLAELDSVFETMYASSGRRSVPPEALLKSTVLMAMYSIRSERAFCERLNYDLLFKWFLDMRIDEPAFDATTLSKNRKRLLEHEVADEFFEAVVRLARLRRYVSSEHFSVDGTLLKAWASHKSFKPTDGPPSDPPAGRNAEVQWHGEKRTNDTHASTTDPDARLYRKSHNTAATLCYSGHLLMEHRNALIVDAELTFADGYAERATALEMLARLPKNARRRTVAGDKAYDTKGFVAGVRALGFTPHVAQNTKHSAIDGRTTRHAGHLVSQRIRKRIEEPFGWAKTIAGGRQLRYRGRQRNRAWFKITAAVYNLIRITALDTQRALA
ncbi:MAG: IS5 family transposase [Ilumatobacteraceae bacterium]